MSGNTDIGIRLRLDGAQAVSTDLSRVEASLGKMATGVQRLGQLGAALLALPAALNSTVGSFVRAGDAVTVLNNQLKLATGSMASAQQAYGALFDIAQRSRVSFTELGGTFASISRATSELGIGQNRLLTVTEAIGNAMAISGGNAQGMQAALTQLGQGFASGTLRGEELNSVMEQTPRLAKAIADGLGITIGQLRAMGQEGKLTAQAVLTALESQARVLSGEVKASVVTVGQAMTQLGNAAVVAAGEADRLSGVTAGIAGVMSSAATSIADVASALRRMESDGRGAVDLGGAIGVAFETIATLGVNTAYVLRGIGNEIGGLAAQAVALATGEFAQVAVIRQAMTADAERARTDVDALTKRILEARRLRDLAQQSLAGVDTRAEDARLARTGSQQTALAKAIAKATDTMATQRDIAKDWADTIRDAQKIIADTEAETMGLTKAQALMIQYLQSPAYLQASEGMREVAIATLIAAHNAEDAAAADKARAKALAEVEAAGQKYLQSLADQAGAAEREAQSLRDQVVEITYGKAAREALVQQRLDDAAAQAQQIANAARWMDGAPAEIEALQRLADKLRDVAEARRGLSSAERAKEDRDAQAEAARKAADEWDRTADSIRDGLTDAFRRAFESGEDFGTAMAKVIERELKARIATALSGLLADGVMAILGIQTAGGAAGSARGNTNWMQLAQTGQTLYRYGANAYNWATSGGSAAMYSTGAAGTVGVTGAQGAYLGEGVTSGVAAWDAAAAGSTSASTGAAGASSGSWGAAAGYAALIAAAIVASDKAYDRGFTGSDQLSGKLWYEASIENATRSVLSKLGVSDKWAEILSGSVALNDSFGYSQARVEAAGVQGTLGAGDFTGQSFADIKSKAGWVRKLFGSDDRTSTEFAALPAELGNFLDTAAKSVFDQAKEFGEALGLPAEALAGITTDIKVTLTEDVEANKAEIAKALGTYGDALVGAWADAVKPLAQYGETTAQTIQRVGGALLGVNGVLDALGIAALDASTAGGQAAIALQELFGGQQGLEQAASGYLNAFYDDAERTNLTLAGIGKTLGEVGLAVPATRDAFRGLVDAQDLTTESGRAAFASLMGVADAFAAVTPAAETAAEAAARMARETERIAAERTGLEERLLQLQGDTAELRRRELAALDPSNRALLEQIHALEDMSEAAAAAARETERVADALADMMDDLASAASDALATVRSTLDAERDRLQGTYNTAVEGIDAQIKAAQDAYAAEVARIDAARDAARADFEATVGPLQAKLKDLDALAKAQAAQYAAGRDALQEERQAAQDVYQAAAKALQDTIAAQQQVVQGLQSLTSSLTDTLRQLRPIGSEGLDRSRAQAQIAQALATARATGALPTAESLRDALSTVVRPSEALFGSFADYQRDFFRTAIDIRDLNDIAGDQLIGAQTALDVAIAQRDDLQAQHEANMERLDGLLTALEEANELARESIAAQRDSLQALIDAARGVFEARTERLDKDLGAAKNKLDATLDPLQQQKEQLAAQLEIDLSALEDLWKQAQAAYDAVVGNNTAALGSVATALGQLDSALAALATALKPGGKPAIPTGQWTASGGTEVWADPAGATALKPAGSSDPKSTIITTPDGRAFTAADARGVIDTAISTGTTATLATTAAAAGISAAGVDALAGFTAGTTAALADPTAKVAGFTAAEIKDTIRILLGEGNLRRIYDLATQYGISSYSVDALGGWARGTSLAWALGQGLPAFAGGGEHWGGLRVVGERGPELEATGPSRIWSFDQLMRLLSGRGGDDVLAAEMRAVRAEVAALRAENSAENQAIASSSADTARQLKRWDGDGMPEVRTA